MPSYIDHPLNPEEVEDAQPDTSATVPLETLVLAWVAIEAAIDGRDGWLRTAREDIKGALLANGVQPTPEWTRAQSAALNRATDPHPGHDAFCGKRDGFSCDCGGAD